MFTILGCGFSLSGLVEGLPVWLKEENSQMQQMPNKMLVGMWHFILLFILVLVGCYFLILLASVQIILNSIKVIKRFGVNVC
jgi:hypothetical protein